MTEVISSNLGIRHEVMNVITSFEWEQPLENFTNGRRQRCTAEEEVA